MVRYSPARIVLDAPSVMEVIRSVLRPMLRFLTCSGPRKAVFAVGDEHGGADAVVAVPGVGAIHEAAHAAVAAGEVEAGSRRAQRKG